MAILPFVILSNLIIIISLITVNFYSVQCRPAEKEMVHIVDFEPFLIPVVRDEEFKISGQSPAETETLKPGTPNSVKVQFHKQNALDGTYHFGYDSGAQLKIFMLHLIISHFVVYG